MTKVIYAWQHKVRGEVIGEIRRVPKGKGKQDLPFYRKNGDKFESGGPRIKPYPLFGIDTLKNPEEPVVICEGQKKQAIWESLGYQCVTSLFGSGSAASSDWTPLGNTSTIYIAPDNDKPGLLYARNVWTILSKQNHSCSIRLLRLPGLPPKGDLCDWLSAQPESGGWDGYTPWSSTSSGVEEKAKQQILSRLKTALGTSLDIPTEWEPEPEWEEPHELAEPMGAVSRLTAEMIPPALRQWSVEIAWRRSCPLEYIAVAAIIVAGSAIGASTSIRPKQKDDWTEYGNLWGFICGPPGTLKTPSLLEATLPLKLVDDKFAETYKADYATYKREHAQYEEAEKQKVKEKQKSKYVNQTPDIIEEPPVEPACKRTIATDTTMEAMGVLMAANPRGLLLYFDEIAQLINTWEKKGREPERQFYLSAWAGNGRQTVDRISREALRIDNMCLSLLGGIQPDKLHTSLVRSTDSTNDGLLQRFQMAVYLTEEECSRASGIVDEYPDGKLRKSVYDLISTIATFTDWKDYGAEFELDRSPIPYFRFEPNAQQEFYRWYIALEAKVNKARGPIRDHLNKFRKLCPTLCLIFHVLDCLSNTKHGAVSLESFHMAAAWCGLMEEHARRIYGICSSSELTGARELAEHISEGKLKNPFAIWEIQKMGWRHLQKRAYIEQALKVLEEYNWVKKIVHPPGSKGGAPKTEFWLNPKLEFNQDGRMAC